MSTEDEFGWPEVDHLEAEILHKPHNLEKSLSLSRSAQDLPFWEETYKKAFPGFATMVAHDKYGPHQRDGIDRSVTLENAKQILIDEKVRVRNKKTGKVYTDIALEYLSDAARQTPGWAVKPLRSDYIAYAIAPLGKCYLLPVLQMQEAWRRNSNAWIPLYPRIEAPNEDRGRRWTTVSTGVPVDVLFRAMGSLLRIDFEPIELIEEGRKYRIVERPIF